MAMFTVAFVLLLAFSTSRVHADTNPPAIFFFGDSLLDVGNNNALPGGGRADHLYYGIDFPGGPTGRFTNGYNMADVIAQYLGFPQSPPAAFNHSDINDTFTGFNYASGGSGLVWNCKNGTTNTKLCYTLEEQLEQFRRTKHRLERRYGSAAAEELMSKSIFTFSTGANDIFYLLRRDPGTLFLHFLEYAANKMIPALEHRLKELYRLGGRKFAIVNVPAIGKTPPAQDNPLLKSALDICAGVFNVFEDEMMKNLSSTLPGMRYSIGNAFEGLKDIIDHPEDHGFKNTTYPCCGELKQNPLGSGPPTVPNTTDCAPGGRLCPNRSEFVFWDAIHPTQATIELTGQRFYGGNLTYASPINLKRLVASG